MTKKKRTRTKTKVRAKRVPDWIKIKLPRDLVAEVSDVLESRGTTLERYLKVTLACFNYTAKPLALDDDMNFGKYAGSNVEDCVRVDPAYFVWLIGQGRADKFKSTVIALVKGITEADGKESVF